MIDMTKTYRTRCGYPVRIYATDGAGVYTVHGAYCEGEDWIIRSWTDDGKYKAQETSSWDLIEVKPRIQREVWVNVYDRHTTQFLYKTREEADERATHDRLACVKLTIDCEHGEGLE